MRYLLLLPAGLLLLPAVVARPNDAGGQNLTRCEERLSDLFNPITLGECLSDCSGWQIAQRGESNVWALPFFSFILPSVVFGIIIPRRRVLVWPEYLLARAQLTHPFNPGNLSSWVKLLLTMLWFVLTFIFAVFDNTIWVFTIFAFAGPMLVGAFEELVLDHKILWRTYGPSREQEAKLLTALVVGNLDVTDTEADRIFYGLQCDPRRNSSADDRRELEGFNLKLARIHLAHIMDAQTPFSESVGGPVLFYVIAFTYAITGAYTTTDSSASIALAFGMWWMNLVHVAMTSGCLLASNNPSTVVAVLGDYKPDGEMEPKEQPGLFHVDKWFPLLYPETFKTSWVWNRGEEKKRWIHRTGIDIQLGYGSYFVVWLFSLILVVVPSVVGIVVAVETPTIGVSCRSLAIILYVCIQILLLSYFTWQRMRSRDHLKPRTEAGMKTPLLGSFVQNRGFWFWFFYCWAIVLAMGSIFISSAGTLLQMMGVYRNCICAVNVPEWLNKNTIIILLPSMELIQQKAIQVWIPTGYAAAGFMGATALAGWAYQSFLRGLFSKRLDELFTVLDGVEPSTELSLMSPPSYDPIGAGRHEDSEGMTRRDRKRISDFSPPRPSMFQGSAL
jgi:hypothetical protein